MHPTIREYVSSAFLSMPQAPYVTQASLELTVSCFHRQFTAFQLWSYYVAQADLKFLASSNLPVSSPWVITVTGKYHNAQFTYRE